MSVTNSQNYKARMAYIGNAAAGVRAVCVNSQFGPSGFIADDSERMQAIANAAAVHPMFDCLGDQAGAVATAWGSALKEYFDCYGQLPPDEILASAAQSLSNITNFGGDGTGSVAMLDSVKASLETSEGVEIRAKQAGLILPVMLMAATSDAATHIPGAANETEIFQVRRVAGSTFGDYKQGDELGQYSFGQYSSMNQVHSFAEASQPDGTELEFRFNSATDLQGGKVPFKRGTVKLMVNRRYAAAEVTGQKLFGTITLGGKEITINGSVAPQAGSVVVTTSQPLPAGSRLALEFDVDIEASPELIPTITHDMDSWTLRPHESVIAAEHTIQAYWTMNREFSLDIRSTQMNHLRNYLSYEKDIKNLRKMLMATTTTVPFDLTIPQGLTFRDHYETINNALLVLSQNLLVSTKVSGLVGLYCGSQASAVFKSLGAPHFEMAPNYKQVPRIHYVGKLFGQWKIFEVPVELEAIKGEADTKLGAWDCLCYARGENHTEAGLVVGDAVAPTMYGHGVTANLRDRNTLWELSYCDIHPNDGGRYFVKFTMVPAGAAEALVSEA